MTRFLPSLKRTDRYNAWFASFIASCFGLLASAELCASEGWIHPGIDSEFPARLVCRQTNPKFTVVMYESGSLKAKGGDDSWVMPGLPWKGAWYEIVEGRPIIHSPFDSGSGTGGSVVQGGQWSRGDLRDGGFVYSSPEVTLLVSGDLRVLIGVSYRSSDGVAIRHYQCKKDAEDEGVGDG